MVSFHKRLLYHILISNIFHSKLIKGNKEPEAKIHRSVKIFRGLYDRVRSNGNCKEINGVEETDNGRRYCACKKIIVINNITTSIYGILYPKYGHGNHLICIYDYRETDMLNSIPFNLFLSTHLICTFLCYNNQLTS